ncbi:single-stranded DNA-binding protein [Cytobacillus sp. IB215665]|uniref:single-stranded DNA-binding protein n=1 Tax=Cytobacillus sp. IB215665 TaxID=3097357 RepID=UPI002A0E9C7F|nr:single-stranded DNA-binding protein [Cytobacillus sp. IB215665]MDX8367679.1 single-stranded DNA-binding protein [Cytobacillus sp. IB215665]
MMNRVILVGRLTKDPELRYTPSGVAVATFTLAVNRMFTNQQGERQADFINCVVWRKPAENVANYLKKGSIAGVDGRVQTRNYEGQDGKRVYVTEIVSESVQFLDTRPGNEQRSTSNNQQSNQGGYGQNQNERSNGNQGSTRVNDNPFPNGGQPLDISDDDLPF